MGSGEQSCLFTRQYCGKQTKFILGKLWATEKFLSVQCRVQVYWCDSSELFSYPEFREGSDFLFTGGRNKKQIYRRLVKVQSISTDKSLRSYLFINNIYLVITDVPMSAFQCFNTESTLMSLQKAVGVAADQIVGFRTISLQDLVNLR